MKVLSLPFPLFNGKHFYLESFYDSVADSEKKKKEKEKERKSFVGEFVIIIFYSD